tara:strand:+ start:662 stop:805 length:144 start_codon:yes stop_codon:yes gene_type:complete
MAWRNSEQLATIVNDTLDIKRQESGKSNFTLFLEYNATVEISYKNEQ